MPERRLAAIKVSASAAKADPANLVEWNYDKSIEIVSTKLDLTHDDAMTFILEELERLSLDCFVEQKTDLRPHVDVYRHDARGFEWYVKVGVDAGRLYVVSFHPPTEPMRPRGVRVTLRKEW